MNPFETFSDLARYYDAIMSDVDYDRWLVVTTAVAELFPAKQFAHLDVGCGTSVLMKRLLQYGWNTRGVDISLAMLHSGRRSGVLPATVAADMRALPFVGGFDYATCLFDTLNFLLSVEDLRSAIREIASALTDGGIFYFDLITERMVTEHFENRKWSEKNSGFSTTWEGVYDRNTSIARTAVTVNRQLPTVIEERIHAVDEVKQALEEAGFTLLGLYDAENWRAPSRKTLRLDGVAAKGDAAVLRKKMRGVESFLREAFQ